MISLSNLSYATCPRCGKVAKGRKEVQILFGYRRRKDGTILVQSWCRKCRHKDTTVCPNCGKIAKGEEEIKRLFGYRKRRYGLRKFQSWCRECRLKHKKTKT